MCGRFFFFGDEGGGQRVLPGVEIPASLPPRYNIAPGQLVAVVPNTPGRQFDFFQWGLVPSWAKDTAIARRLINARAETLAEKPTFRAALRRRRCLIPADGFYEWYQPAGQAGKTPLAFQLASRQPFAFAGLWDVWLAPDGTELYTCTIITTAADPFIAPFHARMPVILDPAHYAAWLDPEEQSPAILLPLLQPSARLIAFPVPPLVNNARIDTPACVEPAGPEITPGPDDQPERR